MPDYVVTVSPTIMDGAVVRWSPSVEAAERCRWIISASRNAVVVHDEDPVTDELRAAAAAAHQRLDADRYARRDSCADLATHTPLDLFGDLVPVERRTDA